MRSTECLPASSSSRRLGWLMRPVRLEDCRGSRRFILRLTGQNLAASVVVAIPLGLLGFDDHHPIADADFPLMPQVWRVALAVLWAAPVLETLLLQAAPIEIARALGSSRRVQFLLGVGPFAALHFPMGVNVGIVAGMVAGAFLSHAYLEGRSRSLWSALWITMWTHAAHNLICMAVLLFVAWAGFL